MLLIVWFGIVITLWLWILKHAIFPIITQRQSDVVATSATSLQRRIDAELTSSAYWVIECHLIECSTFLLWNNTILQFTKKGTSDVFKFSKIDILNTYCEVFRSVSSQSDMLFSKGTEERKSIWYPATISLIFCIRKHAMRFQIFYFSSVPLEQCMPTERSRSG